MDSWLGRSLVSLQMVRAHTGFSSLPACSPQPQPAFHISLTTAHLEVWEVQRPAGILQALVGFGFSVADAMECRITARHGFESQQSSSCPLGALANCFPSVSLFPY